MFGESEPDVRIPVPVLTLIGSAMLLGRPLSREKTAPLYLNITDAGQQTTVPPFLPGFNVPETYPVERGSGQSTVLYQPAKGLIWTQNPYQTPISPETTSTGQEKRRWPRFAVQFRRLRTAKIFRICLPTMAGLEITWFDSIRPPARPKS